MVSTGGPESVMPDASHRQLCRVDPDDEKLCALLIEFANDLVLNLSSQSLIDHLAVRIVEVLPVTGVGLTLFAEGEDPLLLAGSNLEALKLEWLQHEIGEGPSVAARHAVEGVAAPDLDGDPRFPQFGALAVAGGTLAAFAWPLRHEGRCIGALDLYRDTVGPLDPADVVSAQTLADVATSYLVNARLRDEVAAERDQFQHSSLHDPLTGLPNRRLLRDRIDQAARRSRRSATTASVLFVDLDHFKAINDTHGHRVGDAVLCAVATRLESLVRPGDTLARLSGDEFVFLCEDLQGRHDAELLADRIRDAFVEPFRLDDFDLTLTTSASVGVACAGPADPLSEIMLEEADHAMYEAKVAGSDHFSVDGTDRAVDVSGEEVIDPRSLPPLSSALSTEWALPCGHEACEEHYTPAWAREEEDVAESTSLVYVGPGVLTNVVRMEAPVMSAFARDALAEVRTTMCDGIFFTRQSPRGAHVVKRIHVVLTGKNPTLRDVKEQLAAQARDLGAQAVINFRYEHHATTWLRRRLEHDKAPCSWYGEGQAVRW